MSFITSPGVIVPPLTAGGVAYGTGGQAKVNSAGTAGQVLTSAGAGVPIWAAAVGPATPSAEGILYGKTNNLTPFQTFLGYQAGNVTTGVRNTFLGYQAGLLTTTGTSNTVVGESALKNNVTGAQNVAIGVSALEVSTASNNVAVGRRAMLSSTSGASNTGVGTSALESHTTSDFNVALGSGAGNRVTTGASNVMVGASAGFPLTTGSNNICIGDSATASSASVSNENTWGNSSSTSNRFWGDMKMAGANAGTSGQVLTSAGAGVAPTWGSAGYALGTPVDSTSGTSINFTGIPPGVKQIVINFSGVSTTGDSGSYLIQIGDSGGIEDTDYLSRSVGFASGGTAQFEDRTSGYVNRVNFTNGSATIASGSITLTLENEGTFSWVATGMLFNTSANECAFNAGSKSLSAVLDRVRITTVSGTATFDAGQINIAYI